MEWDGGISQVAAHSGLPLRNYVYQDARRHSGYGNADHKGRLRVVRIRRHSSLIAEDAIFMRVRIAQVAVDFDHASDGGGVAPACNASNAC